GGRILRVIDMAPEKELFLPSWWEAPFPLVAFHKDEFYVNEKTRELFRTEIDILQKSFTTSLREEENSIFSCISSTGEERRFFVKKVQEHIFALEDVSNEVHMAQDIVWWAAVGNALSTYLQAKGVEIRPFQEGEALPKENAGTAELIPCRWEDELLGYIQLFFEEDLQGEEHHHEGQTHSRNSL
nr:hypothetical protein [Synergistaceae bacterium]